ncbi:TPA: immunity 52 family protein [Stenotrophomonas maltophilia]|uniref:Imm52 family immunity protein n=1 Tax=Stenotrophomonas maltophilia TaxID=40324 RepID=A0AAJ2JH49_STEMA|nr:MULTISPECIES: Imm52 family immunity protein [Stenotrophomonas]MDQ7280918.1 Imm52 family immunity protein [Stenotrophomonas sp. Sm6012]MDT3470435.1 Imm52 family immunity protein [Stenotrophomonas maltophilia]HEL3180853.1 immunity 52 family protein [Stenotrophomonas maltophilia]
MRLIISVQANLRTTPVGRSAEEVLRLAVLATKALDPLYPSLKDWFALPPSRKSRYVPIGEREALIEQMRRDIEKDRRSFGDFEGLGASLSLANVNNDRDWREPGLAVLGIDPTAGFNKFRLEELQAFGMEAPDLMLKALVELVKIVRPSFACVDVKSRTPEKGLVSYQIDRRLYQHRQFFGWMGFVPAQVEHAQLPDAHAVHTVDGLGTVIVSVPGVFDPADDAQVDKVHRVEMDLSSYNLLPVTDPHFKG